MSCNVLWVKCVSCQLEPMSIKRKLVTVTGLVISNVKPRFMHILNILPTFQWHEGMLGTVV